MSIIIRDTTLELLEQNAEWEQTIDYCYTKWKNDVTSIDSAIRLFSQCWYLLNYWEHLPHREAGHLVSWFHARPELNQAHGQTILFDLQKLENTLYLQNSKYDCITGYLMYVQPEWFLGNIYDDYSACKSEGLRRIKEIQNHNMECSLMANIVLHHYRASSEQISPLFPGESLVDEYFKSILTDWH